jgi:hypothetical protein
MAKKKRPLPNTDSDHEFDQKTKYSQKSPINQIIPSELGWIETRKEAPKNRQQFQFVSNGVTIQFPFTVFLIFHINGTALSITICHDESNIKGH